MKQFKFKNKEKIIVAYKWAIENPVGIIQVIHGMSEHAKRYKDFALFLNKNGYSVYSLDHRGHGETRSSNEHHGEIGHNGLENMISDHKKLTDIIQKENKGKTLIVFGHSMGSFILQEYITRYGNIIDKAILSGSGKIGIEVYLAKYLAKFEMNIKKEIAGSKLLDKLSFGLFNRKYKNKRTNYDWLNRDQNEVDKYIADKDCGNIFPAQFYYYFYDMISKLNKPLKLDNIPKNLSILILSGSMDPVGNYGKGLKKLQTIYKNKDIKEVSLKLYSGGRHEILNEINKAEVYKDILNFIR